MTLLVAIAMLLLWPAGVLGAQRPGRPNILFILIDDMGYADLGCFGGNSEHTPTIDGLAREGIRFTQFYVNAPICSPSRVAVTTGQYPIRWRITSYLDKHQSNQNRGMADWLAPDAPSLARFLRKAGYHTAHVGKWHMGGQRDVGDAPPISAYGFETSITNFEGLGERILPRFEPRPGGAPFRHGPTQMSADLGGGPIHWLDRHAVTQAFVDRAIREMRAAAEREQPFYINLWPDDMHSPIQAPPELRGHGSPREQYAGVLKTLDRQLGRLFDFIRSQPRLRDNTVILLASDNGPERGLGNSGGLRGHKGSLYEGGIKSPLIVWAPGRMERAAGSTNQSTVLAGMDLPRSLLSIASVAVEAVFDGQDMSAVLLGRSQAPREGPIMWVRPPDRPGARGGWPDLAMREGKWKLLVNRDGSRPELFDIPADPREKQNLARQHSEVTASMSRRVREWAEEAEWTEKP